MKTRTEMANQIMKLLVDDGLQQNLITGDMATAENALQEIVESLTMVQARLVATFLVKMVQNGEDKEVIANTSDHIVKLVNAHFDQSVTFQLANLVEALNDLVDSETQTSH